MPVIGTLVPRGGTIAPAMRRRAPGTIAPMTKTLDVLVIGGPASEAAEQELRRRGHRTHRCHEVSKAAFPCIGLDDPSRCPLAGEIDVALLVRRGVHPSPLPEEAGVRCAVRAAVPVVEDGLDVLDPYEGWIASRVGNAGSISAACEDAASSRHDALVTLIRDRISLLCASRAVDPADVACVVEPEPAGLRVDLTVPAEIDRRLEHAFAVRVLDAVRASSQTYGHVNVDVRGFDPVL